MKKTLRKKLRKQKQIDIAMIAVIMGDHMLNTLYEFMQKKRFQGYIESCEEIGKWAVKFYNKYQNITNWSDVVGFPEKYGFSEKIICWDDCVIEFAEQMYQEEVENFHSKPNTNEITSSH